MRRVQRSARDQEDVGRDGRRFGRLPDSVRVVISAVEKSAYVAGDGERTEHVVLE